MSSNDVDQVRSGVKSTSEMIMRFTFPFSTNKIETRPRLMGEQGKVRARLDARSRLGSDFRSVLLFTSIFYIFHLDDVVDELVREAGRAFLSFGATSEKRSDGRRCCCWNAAARTFVVHIRRESIGVRLAWQ